MIIDFKIVLVIMAIVFAVSVQYSLNIIINLLKEIVDLLNLLNIKDNN
ncbi:MAG: hypothetical protein ACQEQE_01395 [Bacillota bacterium]